MKHLPLIPNNFDTWNALPEPEVEAITQAHTALQAEPRATGEFVEAHELDEEAKFVRADGGAFTVTDGAPCCRRPTLLPPNRRAACPRRVNNPSIFAARRSGGACVGF